MPATGAPAGACGRIDVIQILSIHWCSHDHDTKPQTGPGPRTTGAAHLPLPLSKLKAAKRALGAATATDTIERALDLVVFQRQLMDGTRLMLGVRIDPPEPE